MECIKNSNKSSNHLELEGTPWQSNIAIENDPLIVDIALKMVILQFAIWVYQRLSNCARNDPSDTIWLHTHIQGCQADEIQQGFIRVSVPRMGHGSENFSSFYHLKWVLSKNGIIHQWTANMAMAKDDKMRHKYA